MSPASCGHVRMFFNWCHREPLLDGHVVGRDPESARCNTDATMPDHTAWGEAQCHYKFNVTVLASSVI
jgi:hypothetical protein